MQRSGNLGSALDFAVDWVLFGPSLVPLLIAADFF